MTHYHIVSTTDIDVVIANIQFESYEDSIETWVKMSTGLFGHIDKEPGSFAIENAKQATSNGEASLARVGTQALFLYWTKCTGPCYSITWN